MSARRGRAADTVLWAVVAAGLAGGGGRFGRRAALRGIMGAAMASAVVDGLWGVAARRAHPVGRRRPQADPGRAAVGAAFAAGAGQEVPAVAVPLAALAVGAAARSPGDRTSPLASAGGLVVGAGIGLLTRRLWPVAPHEPAEVRSALTRADVEPSADGAGVVIVVNPAAGSADRAADELRAELPGAEVVELGEGDDLEAALRSAAERGCVIGVAGGDGSVNSAAALSAEFAKPLMVVPGGTLNHFAFALGLESVAAAADAVKAGRAVAVDRALIDGHTFVNTASIGSYVDLVDAREKLEARIGKWPAVLVALGGVLRRSEPVELEIDGRRRKVWMIFVGNCRYQPAGFAPSWRERLDDGDLDVRVVDGTTPWSRARLLLSVLTGRLAHCPAYEQRYVKELRVASRSGPLRLARDGETFDGSEEFTICKAEQPLVVYVPGP